ncbi:glycerophosphodiester phosphodiesterase family protein [Sphingobacterium kyonggiense]|uniref:Glycerophosphodiester phosphodiesterase family protein n=1 Tax=Sphingobacterium kyonggiense TaxID=714075 RepID=A0ABP7Z326_9SPHI
MKKLTLFLLLVFIVQLVNAQNRALEIRNKLLDRDVSSVLVVAHRGDWRNAPENSLKAIDYAIDMGVDIIELDVQRTADGKFILMHDKTLDRTTTGKGAVAKVTLDSIRTLKLRNGCAIKTKENVPTLEEALLHAKDKVMINLDKADSYFEEIYPLLEKTGTTKQIIMKGSRNPEEVKSKFSAYLNEVIYMPVVNLDKAKAEENINAFVQDLKPVAFELVYNDSTNVLPVKTVKLLDKKSLIWYNTLWDSLCAGHDDDLALEDPDKAYGYLIDTLGARIIQTDRPAYLINYLKGRGLH